MTLNSEIRQATEPLIRFFEANQIQYHIGGSVASSAHGVPRTTLDVDLVANLQPYQVERNRFLFNFLPLRILFCKSFLGLDWVENNLDDNGKISSVS